MKKKLRFVNFGYFKIKKLSEIAIKLLNGAIYKVPTNKYYSFKPVPIKNESKQFKIR